MSTSGASNHEYVTARVRSRKASLFSEDEYRKLLRMGLGEIARFMEESTYGDEINALGARHDGVDLIEYALNADLAQQFDDLLRWSEGRLYEQIARYLRKFDAWNVKTVLRGLYSNTDRETVEDDLIRAGELGGALSAAMEAESIGDAVGELSGTIFGAPLESALTDYNESGLLIPLENAVDRAYYENLLDGVTGATEGPTALYAEFLEAEIDFRNVRNALRIARSGADIDPEEYFIEGGSLFEASEIAGLAADLDVLIERLRESTYGDQLEAAIGQLEDADSLVGFEHGVEVALLEYSSTLSNRYPLSVCPVLAYVLAKEREVDNIRAIARGREAGLDAEEIESNLVVL
ncbi:MAG: V-type ATP synthase subunit C [Halobacteriales archaeon]